MPGLLRSIPRTQVEIIIVMLASAFAYLLVFKLPAVPFLMEGDHLIFLYDADRMLRGDAMYRDFFQFTFPGGQVVYYFLMLIFGAKYWLLSAVIVAIAAALAYLTLRISDLAIEGTASFLPAIVLIFFGFRIYGIDGSHRMMSPVFILLALLFVARRSTVAAVAASGISCAAASFFTQQRGIIAVAAVAVFLAVESFSAGGPFRELVKKEIALAATFIIGLGAMLAFFLYSAGPDTFYRSTIEYPALYYRFHELNSYGVFWLDLAKTFDPATGSQITAKLAAIFYSFIVPAVPVVFFAVYLFRRGRHRWPYWRVPMLLAIASALLFLGTTAPSQNRIYQVSAPSLILLFWLLARWLKERPRFELFAAAAVGGLLLLGAFQAVRMQTHWPHVEFDLPAGRVAAIDGPVADRYRWLAQNTRPGDHFFELAEPFIYFPLQLRNPTRIPAVFMTELSRPEHIADVLNGLELHKPRYILWENQYIRPHGQRASGDHTGPLSDYVNANYQPVGEPYIVDGRETQIWERRPIVRESR